MGRRVPRCSSSSTLWGQRQSGDGPQRLPSFLRRWAVWRESLRHGHSRSTGRIRQRCVVPFHRRYRSLSRPGDRVNQPERFLGEAVDYGLSRPSLTARWAGNERSESDPGLCLGSTGRFVGRRRGQPGAFPWLALGESATPGVLAEFRPGRASKPDAGESGPERQILVTPPPTQTGVSIGIAGTPGICRQ